MKKQIVFLVLLLCFALTLNLGGAALGVGPGEKDAERELICPVEAPRPGTSAPALPDGVFLEEGELCRYTGDVAFLSVSDRSSISAEAYEALKQEILTQFRAFYQSYLNGESPSAAVVAFPADSAADGLETAKAAYYSTIYDYPEETWWIASTGFRYYTGLSNGQFRLLVCPEPDPALAGDLSGAAARFRAAVERAVSDCFGEEPDNLSELEKVILAHDYLARTCRYDPYVGQGIGQPGICIRTPYGALVEHNAVCQGYAETMILLMNRAGVSSVYVSSENINHAWNLLRVDGSWYHVDVTWDDPIYYDAKDYAGNVCRTYLLKSDSYFQDPDGGTSHSYDWWMEYPHSSLSSYPLPAALNEDVSAFLFAERVWTVTGDWQLSWAEAGGGLRSVTPALQLSRSPMALVYDREDHMVYYANYDGSVYQVNLDTLTESAVGAAGRGSCGIYLKGSRATQKYLVSTYAYTDMDLWPVGNVPASYAIRYDANGGSGAPAEGRKIHNELYRIPQETPVWEFHSFLGWSVQPAASEPELQPGGLLRENRAQTLYAVWRADSYTLRFDLQGGADGPADVSRSWPDLGYVLPDQVPTRQHYSFLCWSTVPTPGASDPRYYPGEEIAVTADMTLYAIWEPDVYTLRFDANGGSSAPAELSVTWPAVNTAVPAQVPVRAHHQFLGWSVGGADMEPELRPGQALVLEADLTLYAVWMPNTYTLHFDANGGADAPADLSVTWPALDTLIPEQAPVWTHCQFLGWATDADGEPELQPGDPLTLEADMTLCAVWQPNTYTLHFDASLGKDAPADISVTYPALNTAVPAQVPVRRHYQFLGWAIGSADGEPELQPGDPLTLEADLTLCAVWQPNTYTLRFDANGGTDAPESISLAYPTVGFIPAQLPDRPHHSFVCWSTDGTSGGACFAPGDDFLLLSDKTLYAVWEPNTYTLSFDANGGADAPAGISVTWPALTVTLPEHPMLRPHYSFLGWADGTERLWQPGESFPLEASRTLTARWEPVRYSLRFVMTDVEGPLPPSLADAGFNADAPYILPPETPVRYGYRFVAWEDADSGERFYPSGEERPLSDSTLPLRDISLRPVFVPDASTDLFAVLVSGDRADVRANAPDGARLLLAAYDPDGRLLALRFETVVSGQIAYLIELPGEWHSLKAFLLDGNAAPLAAARLGGSL